MISGNIWKAKTSEARFAILLNKLRTFKNRHLRNPLCSVSFEVNYIHSKMAKYWPQRSSPKGFSIESLARSYREKISSLSGLGTPNIRVNSLIPYSSESDNIHWANRSFNEYE